MNCLVFIYTCHIPSQKKKILHLIYKKSALLLAFTIYEKYFCKMVNIEVVQLKLTKILLRVIVIVVLYETFS